MDHGANSYRRFLEGDDNGIVEIIRDYKDGLILFLNRYVCNLHVAEELAEDTFFKLVTRKPRFTARYSFKTWLYTIGRNTARNHIRRAGRVSALPVEEWASLHAEEDDLEKAYLKEERKIQVHRALAQLNPTYSRVLYLKFFEELTNAEIAAVMRKSKRQVENLRYQAKGSLRVTLQKEGIDDEDL